MQKKSILHLFIFLGLVLVFPINTRALETKSELITCEYEYQYTDNTIKKLKYSMFSDNTLEIPFKDGITFADGEVLWYHEADFEDKFLESAKIKGNTYTCPTITVEANSQFVTIFNNNRDNCNGKCVVLNAKAIKKDNKIKTKEIVDSDMGSAVGIYQSSKYFKPYFRFFSDGSKEWSINGKDYISVSKSITIKVSENHIAEIKLNKKFIESVFQNNEIVVPDTIYRCVEQGNDNTYIYSLSLNQDQCSKNDLSIKDGQNMGSSSYSGVYGEEDLTQEDLDKWLENYDVKDENRNCNTILGDPEDKDSVAWLLQTILNYTRVIAPILVVILSSLDFAKAIFQSDDETMAKAQKKLIYRLLIAASLFLVPTLVSVLLEIFGLTDDPACALK